MKIFSDEIQTSWKSISPLLTIHNEDEYEAAVARMNELLDEIGTDEKHHLYCLLDTLFGSCFGKGICSLLHPAAETPPRACNPFHLCKSPVNP